MRIEIGYGTIVTWNNRSILGIAADSPMSMPPDKDVFKSALNIEEKQAINTSKKSDAIVKFF